MKIRTGFVSNSSSSSFMIMYNSITEHDALNLSGDRRVCILGDYLGEGRDYFELTTEIAKLIKENEINSNFEYIEVYKEFDESKCDYSKKDFDTLPDKFKIQVFEIDMHTTYSTDEFTERYINRGEY